MISARIPFNWYETKPRRPAFLWRDETFVSRVQSVLYSLFPYDYAVSSRMTQICVQKTAHPRSFTCVTVLKAEQSLAKAEEQLGDGPFFNGETMGNVDIAWLPLLHRALIVEQRSGYNFLAKFPKMKAWQSAMAKTGIAEKSVPAHFD